MSIKESGIYKILNIITKDFYEGSAVNLYNRWNRHRYELRKNIHGKNTYFQNAWNQYGEDNFEFSVLELCEKELLLVREQWYFDNDHPSYNINPVAGNCLGTKHTEESRAKISEAAKNRPPMSEEHKRKIGVANKGKPGSMLGKHLSEEAKRHLSEINSGELHPMFGTHRSAETRAKLSRASKGNINALGYKQSTETLIKMSKAQKGKHRSATTRTKISIARLGTHQSVETRAKNSESQKKRWALWHEANLLEQAYIALFY